MKCTYHLKIYIYFVILHKDYGTEKSKQFSFL